MMNSGWTAMNADLAISLPNLQRQDSGYYKCYRQKMLNALLFLYRLQFSGW